MISFLKIGKASTGTGRGFVSCDQSHLAGEKGGLVMVRSIFRPVGKSRSRRTLAIYNARISLIIDGQSTLGELGRAVK